MDNHTIFWFNFGEQFASVLQWGSEENSQIKHHKKASTGRKNCIVFETQKVLQKVTALDSLWLAGWMEKWMNILRKNWHSHVALDSWFTGGVGASYSYIFELDPLLINVAPVTTSQQPRASLGIFILIFTIWSLSSSVLTFWPNLPFRSNNLTH
jgi:hypothetical protein